MAKFDWILKDENYLKIIEGSYFRDTSIKAQSVILLIMSLSRGETVPFKGIEEFC